MLRAEGKNKILYTKKQRFIKKHFVISIIFTNFAKCWRRNAPAASLAAGAWLAAVVGDEKQ